MRRLDRRSDRAYTESVKPLDRLVVLPLLCLIGCHHGGDGDMSPNQAAVGTAVQQNGDVLSRLPAPVAAAFQKSHPRISPTRVHVRLFPDGSMHYQVIYVDGNGQPQQVEYYGDGRDVR